VEQWSYTCFTITPTVLAHRWQDAGLAALIRVIRNRQGLRGERPTQEASYFVSNNQPGSQQEAGGLFDAIRQHWRIEAVHHRREVTAPASRFVEDRLRMGSQAISRLMSRSRTRAISLSRQIGSKNMAAQLENFAGSFPSLLQFVT